MPDLAVRITTLDSLVGEKRLHSLLDHMLDVDLSIVSSLDVCEWSERPSQLGIGLNAVRAWRSGLEDPRATHVLVLADDMRFCTHFSKHASGALSAAPGPVCLMTGQRAVERARTAGVAWLRGLGLVYGGATCLSRVEVEGFLGGISPFLADPDPKMADDNLLTAWSFLQNIECWATVPSLIQHNEPAASTVGHVSPIIRGRSAVWFADKLEEEIDWSQLESALRVKGTCGSVTKRLLARTR